MTEINVVAVYDPEIIIPSQEHIANLEFWYRLRLWSEDPRPRLGAATLSALHSLINSAPRIEGLPKADFWTLLSPLVSRAFRSERSASSSHTCTRILRSYAPLFGSSENRNLLRADITAVFDYHGIAIATDLRCWPDGGEAVCPDCGLHQPLLIGDPHGDDSLAWRHAFRTFRPNDIDGLRVFAEKMFPKLVFHETAWNRLESLSGNREYIVASLIKHLGCLNDHAIAIWDRTPSAAGRTAELGSLGINASMESSRTHSNKKAMKARRFVFDGESILCEWHTKILRHRDRIYFEVRGDHVYIGAIINHL